MFVVVVIVIFAQVYTRGKSLGHYFCRYKKGAIVSSCRIEKGLVGVCVEFLCCHFWSGSVSFVAVFRVVTVYKCFRMFAATSIKDLLLSPKTLD